MMFGPYSVSKGLCSCGELMDIDSEVFRRKMRLGKNIECRECRNRRIAMEHEQLEMHYLGPDEEESHWYVHPSGTGQSHWE